MNGGPTVVQVEIAAAAATSGRSSSFADGTADGAVVVLVGHDFAAQLEYPLGVLTHEGGRSVERGIAVGVGRIVETPSSDGPLMEVR